MSYQLDTRESEYDIVVVGGGTAGPMAAISAKERNPELRVLLLDKAHVKRSGEISMDMDGLNNAVVPGYASPEQYTKEITMATTASSINPRCMPTQSTASPLSSSSTAGA